MQQELIEMLEKVVDHVVFCNGYDQRFTSTCYGINILKEADVLIEKAKNTVKDPAAHGWSDNQVISFAAMILLQGNRADSIEIRLHQFREDERLRGNAAPLQPVTLTDIRVQELYEDCPSDDDGRFSLAEFARKVWDEAIAMRSKGK